MFISKNTSCAVFAGALLLFYTPHYAAQLTAPTPSSQAGETTIFTIDSNSTLLAGSNNPIIFEQSIVAQTVQQDHTTLAGFLLEVFKQESTIAKTQLGYASIIPTEDSTTMSLAHFFVDQTNLLNAPFKVAIAHHLMDLCKNTVIEYEENITHLAVIPDHSTTNIASSFFTEHGAQLIPGNNPAGIMTLALAHPAAYQNELE